MTFWSQPDFEPLRKYRFLVRMDNSTYRIEAKSVGLPSFESDLIEHKLINHMVKLPGIGKWGDATLSLIVTKDFLQDKILAYTGYKNIKQFGDTLDKTRATQSLGNPQIEILDDQGAIVTTWTLFNAFIQSISYGDLTYEDDGFVEVEITLAIDHAEFNS